MTIYANRSPKDVVRNAFYTLAKKGDVICVATPYFSYADLLLEMAQRGCRVRLLDLGISFSHDITLWL